MSENRPDAVGSAVGAAELARGDYAAVIRKCDETLRLDPKCANAYCNRAIARRALGDLAGARADASAAIQIDPGHAWAHRTLGDINMAEGKARAAIACCDLAIRLDPSLAEAYNTRAGARLLCKQFPAALADCDEAIRLGPQLWGAYITRGNARYHLNDPHADDDYQKAFEINPTRYIRGIVWIIADQLRQEPEEVFANCAAHLQANPQDYASYIRRAIALVIMGKDEEAQHDFDEAIRLKPSRLERVTRLIAEAKRVREAGHDLK